MFDGGEVREGMIGSDPALVVAEDHVHDPGHQRLRAAASGGGFLQVRNGARTSVHDDPDQRKAEASLC
jgi:hypothetical protein